MSDDHDHSNEQRAVEMVLYCWRNGELGIAFELPRGAVELARGGKAALRGVLLLARDAKQPKGVDRLPGMTVGLEDSVAREVMRRQIYCLERLAGDVVSFNRQLDMRFIG